MIFEILNRLFYRLFGSTKLRIYEIVGLDGWKKKLSKDAVEILNRQFELFDLVQRLSDEKIVAFHYLKDKSYKSWPEDCLFPLQASEVLAATVRLRTKGSNSTKLRADIILHKGRLSSIEFNKPPKTIFAKDVQKEDIEVTEVSIIVDPMAKDVYLTEPIPDTSKLVGWLREWAQRWKVENLHQPLSSDKRERILQQLGARLPSDYLELVAQTEGLEIEHCVIYGLSQIRTIVLPDINLYILADIEGRGAVGVRQGNKEGALYYLDSEDDPPKAVGVSFRSVIEETFLKTGLSG